MRSVVKLALLSSAISSLALSVTMAKAETVGTFAEGLAVGKRNGTLIAERVHAKVIARRGCAGLTQFQLALNSVTAGVHPSRGQSTKFIAGFYQGYIDAVKEAIRDVRQECKTRRFSDGLFPGALIGSVYCNAANEDPAALADIRFTNIYDDWSESAGVRDDCGLAFSIVAGDCAATGIAAELLNPALAGTCAE